MGLRYTRGIYSVFQTARGNGGTFTGGYPGERRRGGTEGPLGDGPLALVIGWGVPYRYMYSFVLYYYNR